MDAPAKKPSGVALILGGGDDSDEKEKSDSGAENAFRAFKEALDSNDAAKGVRAFSKLFEAVDEDEPKPEHEDGETEELDL